MFQMFQSTLRIFHAGIRYIFVSDLYPIRNRTTLGQIPIYMQCKFICIGYVRFILWECRCILSIDIGFLHEKQSKLHFSSLYYVSNTFIQVKLRRIYCRELGIRWMSIEHAMNRILILLDRYKYFHTC